MIPEPIQNLISTWAKRPRRQLDYSMLTQESVDDIEWTTKIIGALIPAMKVVHEQWPAEDEIVLQLPIKQPDAAPGMAVESILSPLGVSEEPKRAINDSGAPLIETGNVVVLENKPASLPNPVLAPDVEIPSTQDSAAPTATSSIHIQGLIRRRADTAAKKRRKSGRKGKRASGGAIPAAVRLASKESVPSLPALTASDQGGTIYPPPGEVPPTGGSETI